METGEYEPVGSTSSGLLCLLSSLYASRSFDIVRSLRTFRSPGCPKTLPTSMWRGSERWLDSIFEPCVTVIGVLYAEKRKPSSKSKCSDDDQRYDAKSATTMNRRFSILCKGARSLVTLVVIVVGWRGNGSCRGSRAWTGLAQCKRNRAKGICNSLKHVRPFVKVCIMREHA